MDSPMTFCKLAKWKCHYCELPSLKGRFLSCYGLEFACFTDKKSVHSSIFLMTVKKSILRKEDALFRNQQKS